MNVTRFNPIHPTVPNRMGLDVHSEPGPIFQAGFGGSLDKLSKTLLWRGFMWVTGRMGSTLGRAIQAPMPFKVMSNSAKDIELEFGPGVEENHRTGAVREVPGVARGFSKSNSLLRIEAIDFYLLYLPRHQEFFGIQIESQFPGVTCILQNGRGLDRILNYQLSVLIIKIECVPQVVIQRTPCLKVLRQMN